MFTTGCLPIHHKLTNPNPQKQCVGAIHTPPWSMTIKKTWHYLKLKTGAISNEQAPWDFWLSLFTYYGKPC